MSRERSGDEERSDSHPLRYRRIHASFTDVFPSSQGACSQATTFVEENQKTGVLIKSVRICGLVTVNYLDLYFS